jgi:hypothetical protein
MGLVGVEVFVDESGDDEFAARVHASRVRADHVINVARSGDEFAYDGDACGIDLPSQNVDETASLNHEVCGPATLSDIQ